MTSRRRSFAAGLLAGIAVVVLGQAAIDRLPYADFVVRPLLLADDTARADAIVVAGAGLIGPCVPNLSALRRTLAAAELYRRGVAERVVFTGGRPGGQRCAVADVMADLAVQNGVPADRVLTEATSANTHENAVYAAPVLEAAGVRRVVIVTDRLHMWRASRVFAALGLDVGRASVPVYATNRANTDMLAGAAREALAIAWYRARGWLGPPRSSMAGQKVVALQRSADAATAPVVVLGASYARDWPLAEVAGHAVVNRAVGGQTSAEMAARVAGGLGEPRPRAVIVWGHINDAFRADRARLAQVPDAVEQAYREVVRAAHAAGVDVALATEVPAAAPDTWTGWISGWAGWALRRTSYHDAINATVAAANVRIRAVAAAEGALLLDFERVAADSDGLRRRGFTMPDGSHLTDAAYEALTRYSTPVLRRALAR